MAKKPQVKRDFYTCDEVARRMGVNVRTVQRWANEDKIPAMVVGGGKLKLIPAIWLDGQAEDVLRQWVELMQSREKPEPGDDGSEEGN